MSAHTEAFGLKVLVTGANGMIGKRLCSELSAQGHTIIPAVRRASDSAQIAVGDIGPQTSWAPALERSPDAVVHLAAHVQDMGTESLAVRMQYDLVNTQGTLNLANQCVAAGVRRFIFVSTVKVLGEGGSTALQAADPPRPDSAYAESKWRAELGLWEIARKARLELVVVRPPLVYGPWVKGNFLAMMRAVARGLPLPLGAVRNHRSLVYVGNLVGAINVCLTHPVAAGKTYLVSDAEDISTSELLYRLGVALNKPARLLFVPVWMLCLGGALLGKHPEVRRLVGSLAVDSSNIKHELGWSPSYTMQDGLQETATWYRSLKGCP